MSAELQLLPLTVPTPVPLPKYVILNVFEDDDGEWNLSSVQMSDTHPQFDGEKFYFDN